MHLLLQIALVALGSALGGLTRYGVSVWFGRRLGTGFPWGTLFINLTGSFILGWFSTLLAGPLAGGSWLSAQDLRLLVAVGFTGGYTTFSTFGYEAHRLLGDGDGLLGTIYLSASVFLGLLAVRLGVLLAQ